MSSTEASFKYGYFEFLLELNESELYDIATEIENMCYDGYYVSMFNSARRFFECMLWNSCDYLRIEPKCNDKTEQMSISKTAWACFKESNSLPMFNNQISMFIPTIQEFSHYDESINNSTISESSKIQLFAFLRNCCMWYANNVIGVKLNLPKYVIYKDTKLHGDMISAFLTPYKSEIANLKAELSNSENEKEKIKKDFEQLKNDSISKNTSNNEDVIKYYKDIAEYQKKVANDYYKEIGSLDNCKNVLNRLKDQEHVNEAIRKQLTKLAKERDTLKMQLEKLAQNDTNKVEEKSEETKTVVVEEKPTIHIDENLKDAIRKVILLFDSLGCYITMKTVYKYLVGQRGGYTARYKLADSDGFGMYQAKDLSFFDVTKTLMAFKRENFIKTKDDTFFDLVK